MENLERGYLCRLKNWVGCRTFKWKSIALERGDIGACLKKTLVMELWARSNLKNSAAPLKMCPNSLRFLGHPFGEEMCVLGSFLDAFFLHFGVPKASRDRTCDFLKNLGKPKEILGKTQEISWTSYEFSRKSKEIQRKSLEKTRKSAENHMNSKGNPRKSKEIQRKS